MAVFDVELKDSVSGPAKSAAESVSGLSAEFNALQKQLSTVEQMQKSAFAHHDKNAFKATSEGDVMAQIKQQQQAALAGHDASRDAAAGLKAQSDAAAETSKWFSDLTASGDGLTETLSALNEQFGLAAQLLGAVIAAVAVGVGHLMQMAITATQAKDAVRTALGADTLDMLDELSAVLPFTTDQLAEMARGLKIAGYEGDKLATAIKAVASAEAIRKGGGSAAEGLLKRLKMTADVGGKITLDRRFLSQLAEAGLGVEDLAKALDVTPEKLKTMTLTAAQLGDAMQKALITKGAGPLAQLGMTWDTITAKVKEGIEDAFEDLGDLVGPFMKEVQSLASEFFKGSIASQGFAGVVRSILEPAFNLATSAVRALHLAYLHILIASLQVRIAIAPLVKWLHEIGFVSFMASWGLLALKWIGVGLAIIFGVLAIAVFLCVLPFLLLVAAVALIAFGISKLVGLIGGVISNFDNLKQAAIDAATNFITGLAGTISANSPWVIAVVAALAAGMVGALTGGLQIHSPSRVAQKIGGHFSRGLAQGISGGTPEVQAAARGATGAAVGGAMAGGSGGGGGGITINVEAGAIVIHGAGGDLQAMTEEALQALFERLALMLGAGRTA